MAEKKRDRLKKERKKGRKNERNGHVGHFSVELLVKVTEPLQGKIGNGLKVASFFYQ
jgi:hypothetical protein